MNASQRVITKDDILPYEEYAAKRAERRAEMIALKRRRRISVGPYVTFYFENYDTMWTQVQEMLHTERGGDEQLADELAAYNPLIPQGSELVATMMIEIPDEKKRREVLGTLGHIEDKVNIVVGGDKVHATFETDVERTTEAGKTSSVHFLHFPFTPAQVARFRDPSVDVMIEVDHPNYGHMARLPADSREALAEDFD
ncbi:MAG TPA: DUF3501 family protein [Alphaproteobacteria bacterium]|nr:DUF3501 family protein [Alphaproteobacteria bacterium]